MVICMAAEMLAFMAFDLGPDNGKNRRVLSATIEGVPAGSLDLGLADPDDPDDPKVRLDYVRVHEAFHGTGLSTRLVAEVCARWPAARILGGPVSHDDDPGPRFRLRCWDELGIEIHEPGCQPDRCGCRPLIVAEAEKRYREWFARGGLARLGACEVDPLVLVEVGPKHVLIVSLEAGTPLTRDRCHRAWLWRSRCRVRTHPLTVARRHTPQPKPAGLPSGP